MKKYLLIFSSVLIYALNALGSETAESVLSKTVSCIKKNNAIIANFAITSTSGKMNGELLIKGNKFRLMSQDIKCWYDGKTQWSYSPNVGEVNITTPSQEELAGMNPYLIAESFKKNFNSVFSNITGLNSYNILLTPKVKGDFKQIFLVVDKNTYKILKAVFDAQSGEKTTIEIENYKTAKIVGDVLKFNSKNVPEGTPVVDLR